METGMELFAWFEQTALSIWVRESPLVFPTILIVHALGMGAVVGANVAGFFQILRRVTRTDPLRAFVPIIWIGFVASLMSGALLLAAYPAKALTNPVFYLKVLLIAAGFALFHVLRRQSTSPAQRTSVIAAVALLAMWFGTIAAGRLLAYTNHVLLASHFF
jgi:hypothetical protein